MRGLLDTNAILYVLGGRAAQPLPAKHYFVSVITEIELLSYPTLDAAAENHVRQFLSQITVVGLTREVKESTIHIRRQYGLKLPDAIIAATALVLDADLLTNDVRLLKVAGLSCKALKLR